MIERQGQAGARRAGRTRQLNLNIYVYPLGPTMRHFYPMLLLYDTSLSLRLSQDSGIWENGRRFASKKVRRNLEERGDKVTQKKSQHFFC
jgi:hypothetical protein